MKPGTFIGWPKILLYILYAVDSSDDTVKNLRIVLPSHHSIIRQFGEDMRIKDKEEGRDN